MPALRSAAAATEEIQMQKDSRKNRVATNLSDHEYLLIRSRQKASGHQTISDYLRHCALGDEAPPHVRVPQINAELADSLRAAHSNLNQVVKLAHFRGMTEKNLCEVLDRTAELGTAIRRTRDYLYGEFDTHAIMILAKGKLSREDLLNIISERKS